MKPYKEILFFRLLLAILLFLPIYPSLSVADNITISSGTPIVGAMPIMITAFVNPSSGDVYPAGGTDRYIFSYFDTGSTKVRLDSGTATFLGLSTGTATDIRINGLSAIQDGTLYAPIYMVPPYGPPQAKVLGVGVKVEAPSDLGITLIGAPVANQVIAVIDYTLTIKKGPYPGNQYYSGPDITFYQTPNPPGYTPVLKVALGRAYTSGTVGGQTSGQTYLIYNVKFAEGGNSVTSPASGDLNLTSTKFLYDTGTNFTMINNSLAAALGLNMSSPDFYFYVSGEGNLPGFNLDSLTMTGLNGDTYKVLNAPVLVGTISYYDAKIGSNIFSQTKILFDGPGNILGIGLKDQTPQPPSNLRIVE